MQFSNRFKIGWWIAIIILIGFILFNRIGAIFKGEYIPGDVFLLLLFIALLLVPIFAEIDFFGVVKLKKEVEDLKSEIHINFGEIRNEIKSTISPTFTNQIHFDRPADDEELRELDKKIKKETPKEEHQIINLDKLNVPKINTELFKARYSIEQELKRIYNELLATKYDFTAEYNYMKNKNLNSVTQLLAFLSEYQIFSRNIYSIIREVLLITNQAIHGAEVTQSQIEFVNNNTGVILQELKKISRPTDN